MEMMLFPCNRVEKHLQRPSSRPELPTSKVNLGHRLQMRLVDIFIGEFGYSSIGTEVMAYISQGAQFGNIVFHVDWIMWFVISDCRMEMMFVFVLGSFVPAFP